MWTEVRRRLPGTAATSPRPDTGTERRSLSMRVGCGVELVASFRTAATQDAGARLRAPRRAAAVAGFPFGFFFNGDKLNNSLLNL